MRNILLGYDTAFLTTFLGYRSITSFLQIQKNTVNFWLNLYTHTLVTCGEFYAIKNFDKRPLAAIFWASKARIELVFTMTPYNRKNRRTRPNLSHTYTYVPSNSTVPANSATPGKLISACRIPALNPRKRESYVLLRSLTQLKTSKLKREREKKINLVGKIRKFRNRKKRKHEPAVEEEEEEAEEEDRRKKH